MDETYDKILDDLDHWRSFIDTHEPLRPMIADALAKTREVQQLNLRLRGQREALAERFGKPSPSALKDLQKKGSAPRLKDRAEDDDQFGKDWPGAEALLRAARERGVELDDGMEALIKYTDRVVRNADRSARQAADDGRVAETGRRIRKLPAVGDDLAALVFSVSAYLSAVLTLQIFDRRGDEFRRSLKRDGVDDMSKVVLGGSAAGLPFPGITYTFVAAMADFEEGRIRRVGTADECLEYLKVYELQLHFWNSAAQQHAAIADQLLAR